MNARIAGVVVLASLITLPLLNGQERPTPAQLRSLRTPAASQAGATQLQPGLKPAAMPAGPLVTLEVLLIDYKGRGDGKEVTAPSAAEFVKLHQAGELDRVVRVQLASTGGSPAHAQLGESVPVATARANRAFGGRGGFDADGATAYSYTFQDIGMLVMATSRVEEIGTVLVDLHFERSSMTTHDQPNDAPADDVIGRQKTVRLSSQSTMRLKPDEPAIAKAWQSTAGGETSGQFLVVTAQVQPGGEARAEGRARNTQVRIFALQHVNPGDMQKVLGDVYGDKPIRIGVNATRNAVIVSAPTDQLEDIANLIQALDQAPQK
jgi:hypothetical protein